MATCHVHDSVAVRMRVRVKEKEKVMQILGREDLVGFCASPVVAARATPVRQAPSQVDFTKSAKNPPKKSALTFCRCGVSTKTVFLARYWVLTWGAMFIISLGRYDYLVHSVGYKLV